MSAIALPVIYLDSEFKTQTNFALHVIFRNSGHQKGQQTQKGGHNSKNQIPVTSSFQKDC
jgi:hypothetical protein